MVTGVEQVTYANETLSIYRNMTTGVLQTGMATWVKSINVTIYRQLNFPYVRLTGRGRWFSDPVIKADIKNFIWIETTVKQFICINHISGNGLFWRRYGQCSKLLLKIFISAVCVKLPMVMHTGRTGVNLFSISNASRVLAGVEKYGIIWCQSTHEYTFLDMNLFDKVLPFRNRIFVDDLLFAPIFAVFISYLGLLGLAAFTERRKKRSAFAKCWNKYQRYCVIAVGEFLLVLFYHHLHR